MMCFSPIIFRLHPMIQLRNFSATLISTTSTLSMQIKYEKLPERYKIWKKLAIIFYNLAVSPFHAELISRIDSWERRRRRRFIAFLIPQGERIYDITAKAVEKIKKIKKLPSLNFQIIPVRERESGMTINKVLLFHVQTVCRKLQS